MATPAVRAFPVPIGRWWEGETDASCAAGADLRRLVIGGVWGFWGVGFIDREEGQGMRGTTGARKIASAAPTISNKLTRKTSSHPPNVDSNKIRTT